jgi:hypothetical protein
LLLILSSIQMQYTGKVTYDRDSLLLAPHAREQAYSYVRYTAYRDPASAVKCLVARWLFDQTHRSIMRVQMSHGDACNI